MRLFRALVVLAVVAVGVLIFAGVVYFRQDDDKIDITIDKRRLNEATEEAVKRGKEVLDEAGKALRSSDADPQVEKDANRSQASEPAPAERGSEDTPTHQ